MKRNSSLAIKSVYFFLLSISSFLAFYVFIPRPQEIALSQFNAQAAKRVISISPVQNKDKSGVLVLRLRDAMGQFLEGDFSTTLSGNGEDAIAYKDNHAYFIIGGNKIISTTITASFGNITKASFSPDADFAAIETLSKTGSRSFCLFKINGTDMKSTPCNNLTVIIGEPTSTWLPDEGHTFVIIDGNTMTTWNLDDSKWSNIKESENPLIFEYVKSLLIKKHASWNAYCSLSRCYIHDEFGSSLFKVDSGLFDTPSVENITGKIYAIYNKDLIWFVDISANTMISANISQLPAALTADSRLVGHE